MLDELGSPATVATTGGRYFGYVIGGVLPAALGANWLAGAWDQNATLRAMSPIAAELEDVVLRWICDALHLPAECEGGLVTGATTANFTALAAARYAVQISGNLAALLMQVEIDRPIPPQLFEAVAELLAWLYRLEGRAAPRPT